MSETTKLTVDLRRNLREARTLTELGKMRIRVLAPPDDVSRGRGASAYVHRACRAADRSMILLLRDWTLTYSPEFPLDWGDHPLALRAIEIYGFAASGSQVRVAPFRANVLFFPLSRKYAEALLTGGKTENDLLAHLEKTRKAGHVTDATSLDPGSLVE